MKNTLLILIGIIGLGLTLIPSMLVFSGAITLEMHRTLMFIGTVIWMVTAPFWLGKEAAEGSGN